MCEAPGAPSYLQRADQHGRMRRRANEVLDNLNDRGNRREIERERVTHNQWLLGAVEMANERYL